MHLLGGKFQVQLPYKTWEGLQTARDTVWEKDHPGWL